MLALDGCVASKFEREFLLAIRFDLLVQEIEYEAWIQRLEDVTESLERARTLVGTGEQRWEECLVPSC